MPSDLEMRIRDLERRTERLSRGLTIQEPRIQAIWGQSIVEPSSSISTGNCAALVTIAVKGCFTINMPAGQRFVATKGAMTYVVLTNAAGIAYLTLPEAGTWNYSVIPTVDRFATTSGTFTATCDANVNVTVTLAVKPDFVCLSPLRYPLPSTLYLIDAFGAAVLNNAGFGWSAAKTVGAQKLRNSSCTGDDVSGPYDYDLRYDLVAGPNLTLTGEIGCGGCSTPSTGTTDTPTNGFGPPVSGQFGSYSLTLTSETPTRLVTAFTIDCGGSTGYLYGGSADVTITEYLPPGGGQPNVGAAALQRRRADDSRRRRR